MHTDRQQRQENKRIYKRVCRVVDHQTTPQQLPGCTPNALWTTLVSHSNEDHDAVDSALTAAIDNGDIIEWHDEDGTRRLTPANIETLRRAAAYVAEWDEPDTDLIGEFNSRIQDLGGNHDA